MCCESTLLYELRNFPFSISTIPFASFRAEAKTLHIKVRFINMSTNLELRKKIGWDQASQQLERKNGPCSSMVFAQEGMSHQRDGRKEESPVHPTANVAHLPERADNRGPPLHAPSSTSLKSTWDWCHRTNNDVSYRSQIIYTGHFFPVSAQLITCINA